MPEEIDTVKEKEVDKVGRPCKYDTHVEPYFDKIYEWLKKGMTDYSIAEQLGIHESTWIRYKEKYDNLTSLYTRARTERNRLVMNRMYAKACGEIAQVKQEKLDKQGNKVMLTSEIYTPPDVNAADLYLRNNDPDYRQAKQVESGQTINVNVQLPQLEQELQQIAEQRKTLEMQLGVDFKRIE
jgi:CHAT domain-containing protein